METLFDVIIIGGGPIGLSCALAAQQKGLRFIVIEKGTLVNSLYNYPVNMTFFSTSEKLEIGNVPFVSNSSKPTRAESLEYYRRVTRFANLPVQLFEAVLEVKKRSGNFEVITTKGNYTAANVIIATGFFDHPYLLNITGENLPKVAHYYKDPHFYAFQKVAVIGANNSAVDAALETYRKGAMVTMIIRGAAIGEDVKYWARPDIINRINEGSIRAYFNASVVSICEKEVVIHTPEGLVNIENDYVLAMTGYKPDLEFLEKIGIELAEDKSRKPFYHPDTYETNVKGIYLAGVICGGMNTHSLFIENSRDHGFKIMDHIIKKHGNTTITPTKK